MQIPRLSLFTLAIVAAAISWQACSHETSMQRNVAVAPPFKKVQVAYQSYEIDPVAGGVIKLENGTRITVPANAFTDANGNLVKDKVQLQYREFHSTADIIASGIPMCYDSAGKTNNFESAGMFDINGSCNGAPVQIAEGKKLDVRLASYRQGNDFNFYYYDKQANNWDCKGQAAPAPNVEKETALAALPELPVKPADPVELDKNACVMNLDVNYKLYPELEAYKGIVWQYAGEDENKAPCKDKVFGSTNWTDMQLEIADEQKFIYQLDLKTNNKKYVTRVKPVLDAREMAKAKAEFEKRKQAYNQIQQYQRLEKERLDAQANLMRSFSVSNFGIYNWDRIMKENNVVPVAAHFEFDQELGNIAPTVFLVSSDDKVVTYYPGSWDKFSYDPDTRNTLIAVMPGDVLAVCSPGEFNQINKRSGKATFKLKTTNKKISSVQELDKTLKEII